MRTTLASLFFTAFLATPAVSDTPRLHAGIENEVAVEGYNNEPIVTYAPESDFFRLGRAVGQLRIVTDAGPAPCTAFIVSDRHILTNNHCIPGVLEIESLGATRILSVSFAAGFINPGLPEEAEVFAVNPVPVETDKALDYTVLEVIGNPAAKYGTLPLSATTITAGTPFLILGHPLGKSLHISREGCRAARPPLDGDRLRHTCDTLGGNSGSPIIDASSRSVVGLHNSGDRNEGVNFGIPMALILASSRVLTAAPLPAPPEPSPTTLALRPRSLSTGDELYLTADMPSECAPAFFDIAPSGRLTPVPLEFFERIDLSAAQARYQVTAASRYGLVVLEADERGRHVFGYVCAPPGGGDLKPLLREIVPQVNAGVLAGQASGTAFRFQDYTID